MSLGDVRPGDIGFGPIHGAVGAGIGAAQLALAAAERGWVWRTGVRSWWRKRHVLVVTKASITLPPGSFHHGRVYATGIITTPQAVQAMPGGAEEIELRNATHWTDEWTFLRPAYALPGQAQDVADAAREYVIRPGGTPYDFRTYGAIPLWRRGIHTKLIKDVISDTDTMMCSRLADAALRDAGWQVFDDGRLPGDVTPSELYRKLTLQPGVQIFSPIHRVTRWS